jgi:integrase
MIPAEFKARHGYAYYHERKKRSLKRALAEMALLSHVFTKAIEWGVVDENPCRQIRKERPKPRRRYVTEAEYEAAYRAMPVMVQCAMDLAVLTGLRPGDLLGLERDNVTDEGLEVATIKTGKRLLIEWSAELKRVVKRTLKQPPRMRRPIICNKQGNAYTVDGFNSNWYRAIRAAIADPENPLAEPFRFRDLRAKSASDDTAEAASKRLGHADPGITERVYRRKPARARPLR